MTFDTLRFQHDTLELLDQRALPEKIQYLSFTSAQDVAKAIQNMVVRGAPAIGCAAAYGIALEAVRTQGQENFEKIMEEAFAILAASRPTAVNLFWALEKMREAWGGKGANVAHRLRQKADEIFNNDIAANLSMGKLGADLLPRKCSVLTYCNAGALATAGHGTALGVIRSAKEAGKHIRVYSCETRPLLQGARLTAWELSRDSIPVTVICDNMAGYLMSLGRVDAVVVGADRVAANGDVANKIGTYTLAVLAKRHGIPFYVACPTCTIDPVTFDGKKIPIEERAHAEVASTEMPGVSVWNPAFDVTPAELVTAIVTEAGVIHSPDREKIASHLNN